MPHYDDCLLIIRIYSRWRKSIFPNERLGTGDRLLLNSAIKKQTKLFRKYERDNKIYISSAQYSAIFEHSKEFGFKPKIPENLTVEYHYGPIPKRKKPLDGD